MDRPPPFPMFLDLVGRRCLVLGADSGAARKADLLERCGASVVRCARLEDVPSLEGFALAMAAGATPADAQTLAQTCRSLGIPVNVTDELALCSFITPAIVDRAPVMVAISTGGRSPQLAKLIREALDKVLPLELGALGALAGRFRNRVRSAIADPSERRRFWHGTLTGPIAALVFAGRERQAEDALRASLARSADRSYSQGAPGSLALVPDQYRQTTLRSAWRFSVRTTLRARSIASGTSWGRSTRSP